MGRKKKNEPMFLNGEQIQKMLQERANAPKKYLRLHTHPDNLRKFLTDLMEECDEPFIKGMVEDAYNLVEWALARLPLVAEKDAKQENGGEVVGEC